MMRGVTVAALAVVSTAPALGQTGPFQGGWTQGNPSACVYGRDDVNYAMRIIGNTLQGLETQCQLANPTAIRDMSAMLFDARCFGEGEEWSNRLLMMIDTEGRLVTIANGYVATYQRCR